MRKLNDREVATILHGLRMIQCEGRLEGCLAGDCEHFEEAAELSNEEIDDLCESVNCGDFDPLPEAQPKELKKLIRTLKRTFDGDSNDAEHDAAVELADYLEEHALQPTFQEAKDRAQAKLTKLKSSATPRQRSSHLRA